jgi:hypothetical protein
MPGKLKVVRFADDDVYYSPAPSTPSPTYSSSSLPSSGGPFTPQHTTYYSTPLPPVSELYPSPARGPVRIHPALGFAAHPTYAWDVTYHPTTTRTPLPANVLAEPATNPPLPSITIISPYLPWSIAITPSASQHKLNTISGTPAYVTVADVLSTLYRALRLAVRQAEYDKLPSLEAKHSVNEAYQARCRGSEQELRKGVKRVDFLGTRKKFMGLSSSRAGPNVWVLNVS